MTTTTWKAEVTKKLHESYFLYLILITLIGISLSVWGVISLSASESKATLALLILLTITAQIATTTVPVSGSAGITYQVAPAIVMASLPLFGPAIAALLNALSALSLWLIKPANKTTWKKSKEQLFFNIGMSATSVFIAGFVLLGLRTWLAATPLLAAIIPWFIGALVYDQVNYWLLLGILRLQHGPKFNVIAAWKDNIWAVPISILLMALGGGVLAFAMQRFDWVGVIIFFLPVILSAIAFRIYVRQMQEHMDNLEAIVTDRTGDLAMAIEELRSVNKELAGLNAEKDAFLAVLTHDMKTPLTSISIYAGLLKENPQLILKKPHIADVILRSQNSLLEIVNNILDLEKLQVTGGMPLDRESFDLTAVIHAVSEVIQVQALEKGIVYQFEVSPTPIVIHADRKQIERVILNLVSNAIKYTPKDGNVDLTLEQNEKSVIINITDTGYGIPETELPHIFERFRRVSKHKNIAVGTGLGLAITKALIEAHNGDISVNSVEGEGSIFTVTLPLVQSNS